MKRKQLKVKLSMAKFLQDTVEEMAVSADNQENQEETKAFFDFIEKVCILSLFPKCFACLPTSVVGAIPPSRKFLRLSEMQFHVCDYTLQYLAIWGI